MVETDSFKLIRLDVLHQQVTGLQIPIGLSGLDDGRPVLRPILERDLPPGSLIPGQMRGRTLPVASARFAMQLAAALQAEASRAGQLTGSGKVEGGQINRPDIANAP